MTEVPEPLRVPTAALPPAMPSTFQETAPLLEPVTAAVKGRVPAAVTLAVPAGVRLTATGAGVAVAWTVTRARALAAGLAALVAVIVRDPAEAGAV